MLPLIIAGVVIVSIERRAEEERENKRRAKILDEERRSIRHREIEVERAKNKLASEQRRAQAELKGKKKEQKEEEERRKQEEEEARIKLAEQERDLAKRVRRLEKEEKEQKEAIEKRKREQAAQLEAEERFGGPLRWPTREEFQETLNKTQYDSSRFHFAIVGRAGCGKSSLINAFRNLGKGDHGAAPTGTTETTLETARYPDLGTELPRKWMVWFDIPGAGTQRIPHKDYFVKQGLYVFDLIILAIGDRFEEIDARIMEDCARFKVPVFIVRSKADMHILNTMKEHNGDCARITDDPALYGTCREGFVTESQKTVSEGLARQKLPDQHVYVVSRDVLRRTYNSALHRHRRLPDWGREPEAIHESQLVKMILTAAVKRRCKTDVRMLSAW
ncbi:interferon-inducible GTPase-domain-containing protein [Morchella snyderi]|nr:interferon-inducible GTPase-domain-containing protein [Morchella snyderi]